MKTVFEGLAKYALLRAVLHIALGVLMLLAPQAVMNVIVYILATYVVALGVINIVDYLRHRREQASSFGLVSGILLLVLGAVMFAFTNAIISILPIFLGVLLMIGGITVLGQAVSYGRLFGRTSILTVVLSILVIVGGVLVVLNPFSSAVLLFQVFGVALVVMGVGELVSFFSYRSYAKNEDRRMR